MFCLNGTDSDADPWKYFLYSPKYSAVLALIFKKIHPHDAPLRLYHEVTHRNLKLRAVSRDVAAMKICA